MTEITADDKVAAFVLREFRDSDAPKWGTDPEKHLAACDSARVSDPDLSNGAYGCDTGCEYARLEATISCDHGVTFDYTYGTFGEISNIIAEIG